MENKRIEKIIHALTILCILVAAACSNASKNKPQERKVKEGFPEFVKQFDTLPLPLLLNQPGFLKENTYQFQTLRKIDPKDLHAYMMMDSIPPWPVYYYGQLPMLDSTYYLINYFEVTHTRNPSMWFTLMKFDYYGTLLSETNISYSMKDSNEVRQRFCKIMPNYQCFYVESNGIWDPATREIKDTVLSNRTLNLTYDLNR